MSVRTTPQPRSLGDHVNLLFSLTTTTALRDFGLLLAALTLARLATAFEPAWRTA